LLCTSNFHLVIILHCLVFKDQSSYIIWKILRFFSYPAGESAADLYYVITPLFYCQYGFRWFFVVVRVFLSRLFFSASCRFRSRNYILSSYMINVNKQFIPCVYHITYLDFVHSMKFIFIADRQQRCPEGTYLISVNRQFLQIYQITVL